LTACAERFESSQVLRGLLVPLIKLGVELVKMHANTVRFIAGYLPRYSSVF
jgi:hypothetical protein